ncbi:restriction endonuclease [Rhodopirellula bahusiensis]|uniref:Restriction endonuclease n=1 Tax=Rhodopirellula bahusiensis TaxID=2014065 RepID=A0A2G1W6Y5_9BACT|nr:restriction endonuclease [Rhodopirellula bahusiensis]PHQ34777.1 restriction endonuclease [Rhodopirellula bahusiensis]
MAIPDFQSIMLPFMQVLSDEKTWTTKELTEQLAVHFKLSEAERHQLLPSGQQAIFTNRVAWAKTHLKNAGLILNPSRGKVNIADAGLRILNQKPTIINCKVLKQFPSYLKFIGAKKSDDDTVDTSDDADEGEAENTKTPLELIESSFEALHKATAEELLTKLKTCSPAFFERVVVLLLRAMGYGGVTGDGSVTGKSGDGGIDGIIKEDKLGLDVVCIQAKRYSDLSVGRPIVQQFVGSMDFVQANKGVIITTSQFSKDANEFVDRIVGKKIVLIDGPKLADFMIEHNVGISKTKIYELKEVSNDFFDEDEG